MKLVYLIHSLYNPGGMERVLLNKVRYLVRQVGYDLLVVTTDAHDRPTFYPFPDEVRMVDLGINYSDDNASPAPVKILRYFAKRRLHRQRLTDLLQREKADVVISLYPSESSFLPDIQDGSRKILEIHYGKLFRRQYNRRGLLGLADRFRTWQDTRLVRRFDRFVVLTEEDRKDWGALPNMCVIPNAAYRLSDAAADVSCKRVVAVGRLDYQKSFDRLLDVWAVIQHRRPDLTASGWHLDIYGQGPWHDLLQAQALRNGTADTVTLHAPVTRIGGVYAQSAFLVMTSHYEGLPMVMLEAMACGLPVASFGFKCGPADIIRQGINGFMVQDGDVTGLADAMIQLMDDLTLRQRMAGEALQTAASYTEETIMQKWQDCFRSILS